MQALQAGDGQTIAMLMSRAAEFRVPGLPTYQRDIGCSSADPARGHHGVQIRPIAPSAAAALRYPGLTASEAYSLARATCLGLRKRRRARATYQSHHQYNPWSDISVEDPNRRWHGYVRIVGRGSSRAGDAGAQRRQSSGSEHRARINMADCKTHQPELGRSRCGRRLKRRVVQFTD